MNALTTVATTSLVPHNMDEALRLAEFMARARTVPKHLQDSPGDCLMVIELAMRWGMSPFAVAQGTSVISGKLMFEGKLVAAAVETSGAIAGQFDYDFAGEGETRSIIVSATRRGETNSRSVTVTLKEAKTNNDMWKRQPDQQLVYHGVRVWARRWTPSVILGVYSREEMGPIIDGQSEEVSTIENTAPDARDAMNAAIPMTKPVPLTKAAKGDRFYREPPSQPPLEPKTAHPLDEHDGTKWLSNLESLLVNAQSQDEVVEIAGHHSVGTATAKAPAAVRARISELLAAAYGRFPETADADASHEPASAA